MVATLVIDLLEVVQVEHQEAETAARAFAARDLAGNSGEEEGPIVEASERVEGRQAQSSMASEVVFPADRGCDVREQEQSDQIHGSCYHLERGWSAAGDACGA